jgi:predicted site-specific integrase-resolvase
MINLEKFGGDFIKQSRDMTLDKYKLISSGKMKSEDAQKILSLLNSFNNDDIQKVNTIVANMVDRTIFNVLYLFEQSNDWVIVDKKQADANSLENIAEISDGLSGELYGRRGWIEKYSQYNNNSPL